MNLRTKEKYHRVGVLTVALFVVSSLGVPMCTAFVGIDALDARPLQAGTVWELLEHDYQGTDIWPKDVVFVNATHGWVLTQNVSSFAHGIILHTQDSGDSWSLQLYNQSAEFMQICVLNSTTLWASSYEGLVHTYNGGQTWETTTIGDQYDVFYSVEFFNTTYGWTGSNQGLYETNDAGASWKRIPYWSLDDTARMIHFTTELDVWVIGFYGIYYTSDGGMSWSKGHNRGGWAMSFVSETEGWAVADNMLAHMTDGETWVEQPMPRSLPIPPPRAPYYTDIEFIDSSHGWIGGFETEIAYTPDGGNNWYSQTVPVDTRIYAIYFVNETLGWAVGSGGYILRTSTGDVVGVRLWTSIYDLVIPLVVGVASVVVIGGGILYRKRSRTRKKQINSNNLELV